MNYVDFFAKELREKREARKTTQIELAEKLNMCSRTIIEIENRKSNPRFETVALIAKEMNISLDGIVFYDELPREIPKCVIDFFAGKSEAEAQKYIDLAAVCTACAAFGAPVLRGGVVCPTAVAERMRAVVCRAI